MEIEPEFKDKQWKLNRVSKVEARIIELVWSKRVIKCSGSQAGSGSLTQILNLISKNEMNGQEIEWVSAIE